MKYPLMILNETEDTGIVASVYHLQGRVERVFATNILLVWLRGEKLCTYGGRSFSMKPGDVVFLCENQMISMEGQEAYGLFISIPSATLKDRQQDIQCSSPVMGRTEAFLAIQRILGQLIENQSQGGTFYKVRQQALWKDCIYQLLTSFYSPRVNVEGSAPSREKGRSQPQREGTGKETYFSEILDIVENNYRTCPQLKELAEMYYYTPSHLSKLFVKYTGLHFSEYLTEVRLKKAMPLLIQTKLEISVISDRVGFPNPRAFQQAFQKKYQLRPSKYRADFERIQEEATQEQLRANIYWLRDQGLLELFPEGEGTEETKRPSRVQTYLGAWSVSQSRPFDLALKNQVLNVYCARDLLLDSVRHQVLAMKEQVGCRYLSCHTFLSDDMQIFFEDHLHLYSDAGKRYLRYDFSLYEKILSFVKDAGMHFIIQLGYTPSFLAAPGGLGVNVQSRSRVCMPKSMEEWKDYISQLFSYLYRRFGDWLVECPVAIWQVPDLHIKTFGTVTMEEFLELYRETYQVVKKTVPGIQVGSPTITCSQNGISFARELLAYSRKWDCVPDRWYVVHIISRREQMSFHIDPVMARNFAQELGKLVRSKNRREQPSITMLEYYHNFGVSPVNDAMVGAMVPLETTLENQDYYDSFGYLAASDLTTETVGGTCLFFGGRGLVNRNGGRKSIYYGLYYLSRLGGECLATGNGYVVTREGSRLKLLLYYDIPQENWVEEFSQENALHFYEMFLDWEVSLELTDLEDGQVEVREQHLNPWEGGSYEKWLKSGSGDMGLAFYEEDDYDAVPVYHVFHQAVEHGTLRYQCTMRPFEIRFVVINTEKK